MKGFFLAVEGQVQPDWIDRNRHMNMARYLALFDSACDEILSRSGLLSPESDLTFVAGRVQMAHRRELLQGDEWQVWSGFTSVTERTMVFSHRLASAGRVHATCDILGSPFSMSDRARCTMKDDQVDRLRTYIVPGLRDPFDTRGPST